MSYLCECGLVTLVKFIAFNYRKISLSQRKLSLTRYKMRYADVKKLKSEQNGHNYTKCSKGRQTKKCGKVTNPSDDPVKARCEV